MSKLYIPALALALVGGSAAAQQAQPGSAINKIMLSKKATAADSYSSVRRPVAPMQSAARDIIWSDDFSDPSLWVAGTTPAEGAPTIDEDTWVIGSAVPDGPAAIAPIESSTAANGYALFDSDLYCGGEQNATLTMATGVDLSGYPGVLLQYEQYTARWRGDYFVDVSNDGGTVWTPFEVNVGLAVTSSTTPNTMVNPELATVNISSVAAGFADVRVRFRYFSVVGIHAADAGCDYAWMVDDVAFVTLPENEIIMNFAYTSTTGTGEEYGRIPTAQMPASMNLGAEIFNFGSSEQTNVTVNCTVAGPTPFSTAIPLLDPHASGTIPFNDTATADMDFTLPGALGLGIYNATFTLTSDQVALDANPADNVRLRNFEVTQDIYSVDAIGNYPEGVEELAQTGTASFEDNAEGVKLMNMFIIRTPMEATGLQIALGSGTVVGAGASIKISMLDTAAIFADLTLVTSTTVNNFVDGIESDWYNITPADVAAGVVTIEFPSPVSLSVNAYYAVATIRGNGTTDVGTDAEVFILDDNTVPQPPATSALWIPFDILDDGSEGPHFYGGNGTAWAIRLTSNTTISVAENTELEGVTMFPNPTNDVLRINTTTNEKFTVEVMNILGELIMTTKFTGMTVLDLDKFADGVYSVRVSNGTKATVQRVTLN